MLLLSENFPILPEEAVRLSHGVWTRSEEEPGMAHPSSQGDLVLRQPSQHGEGLLWQSSGQQTQLEG